MELELYLCNMAAHIGEHEDEYTQSIRLFSASNPYEACWIAERMMRLHFPESEGWEDRSFFVQYIEWNLPRGAVVAHLQVFSFEATGPGKGDRGISYFITRRPYSVENVRKAIRELHPWYDGWGEVVVTQEFDVVIGSKILNPN